MPPRSSCRYVRGAERLVPPRRAARDATDDDLRGWSSLKRAGPVGKGVEVAGRARRSTGRICQRAVFDGEAALVWRGVRSWEIAAGLLREQWGRFPNSTLDALGRPTRRSRWSAPERRLEPADAPRDGIFRRCLGRHLALAGSSASRFPRATAASGSASITGRRAARASMGDQSVAVRVSAQRASTWTGAPMLRRSQPPANVVARFTSAARARQRRCGPTTRV